MSKLETLVPPVDLCKLIPEGEFEDSAFMCEEAVGMASRKTLDIRIIPRQRITSKPYIDRYLGREYYIYPAPTLEEIMAELPSTTVCGKEHHSDWYVSHWRIGCVEDTERKGAATAALKLWLKLKELKHE